MIRSKEMIDYEKEMRSPKSPLTVEVPDRCEPYFYAIKGDETKLLEYIKGDTITLKFSDFNRVKKEFRRKTIEFKVLNHRKANWGWNMHWLALQPVDSTSIKDIIYVAPWWRFEAMMIDLFPCNRKPYAGWKKKAVEIVNPKPVVASKWH